MIQIEEQDQVPHLEVMHLKKTFEAALKKFEIERLREGLALKKDLQKNLRDLQKYVLKISKLREEANKMLQEKYLISPHKIMSQVHLRLLLNYQYQ